MLNTTNQSIFFKNNQNIKVNAVSGGIVKNHPDSFFLRFHLKSSLAEMLLSPKPYRKHRKWSYDASEKYWYVEVLQLVIVGDMEVVAEVIDLKEKDETN